MLPRLLLTALLAALLVPQVGNAHVHLCLDGQGPAVSMHTPEPGDSCSHVDSAGHHDHAFEVDSPAIGKLWPPGLDAALLVVVLVLFAVAPQLRMLPVLPDGRVPALPPYLRPPLRGPPA